MSLHRIALILGLGFLTAACAGQQPPGEQTVSGPAAPTSLGATPSGAYLAARHAQLERDNTRAADLYLRALAFAPDDPELLRRAFSTMASEGRIDEAAMLAERLKNAQMNIQLGSLVIAVHAAKAGQYSRAEQELAGLPDSGFNNFISPLLIAWARAGRGDTGGAVAALLPMERTRGFEAFANLHAALILDVANDRDAAAARYAKTMATNSGFIRAVQAVASFYARNGQEARARDIYLAFETAHPESGIGRVGMGELSTGVPTEPLVKDAHEGMAEALFNLSSLLHQQNLDEVALVLGQLSLYLRPNFDIAELLIADIMESTGQSERAVAIYEGLPTSSTFNWSARLRAAAILDDLGRTDEAIAHLNAMSEEQPKRVEPLVAMGDILRGRERFAEAVVAYDRAIARIGKVEPRHWSVLYARGISLERTKQWARAEADFLKALEFNPEQPYVLNYLGYSWLERGEHLDRALQLIEKAVRLRPEDGYIVDSMGWALYLLGQYDGAVSNLERAAELRPQDPVINDHLGDAYWRVGRQMEARFQWRRALSLQPQAELSRNLNDKLVRGLAEDKSTLGNARETTAAPDATTVGRGI